MKAKSEKSGLGIDIHAGVIFFKFADEQVLFDG